RAVGGVDHPRGGDRVDRGDDRVPLLGPAGIDRDVAQRVGVVDPDEVDRADGPAGGADRAGHQPEHPGLVLDLDADRQRVLGGRRGGHAGASASGSGVSSASSPRRGRAASAGSTTSGRLVVSRNSRSASSSTPSIWLSRSKRLPWASNTIVRSAATRSMSSKTTVAGT